MIERRKTRQIQVGQVPMGGGAPVVVQTMTKTETGDVAATLAQIRQVAEAGCDVVRVAVPDQAAAYALPEIVRGSPMPVIADIHFHYQFALAAIAAGCHKIRWNPGNIRKIEQVQEVVEAAKARRVALRIGVNAGSLDPECSREHPHDVAAAMVASAMKSVRLMESLDFHDLVLSLKASDVLTMMRAYRLMAKACNYPLHLGVTEAGLPRDATIKSSIGIGGLLAEGIGDTIRVSITGDPVEEVKVGQGMLSALGLRRFGAEIIACPSCGRVQIDLVRIASEVDARMRVLAKEDPRYAQITLSIMGCVVNGPGEAHLSDIGLSGGGGMGIIYRKGEMVRRVPEAEMVEAVIQEAKDFVNNSKQSAISNQQSAPVHS
ncbi:MAG: flavodoxin-dependent (E)-4-hydroxy-3-methylbut-2-enyl-diphosphate synthase [Candidatus Omnitrophica bacterium]|nr:flavodoxin-dependent (E)-4-hydroxy-3-methylbut-2-enyl-diphosphate synthase [Candidatus Omnitrophota bacterium]